ncbi:MAG: NAD(P)-binding domain-containing protein, partial [Pseudomonadota bacterium]
MAHLGLVGVGVMGSALAQNLAEKGHKVSLYDRDLERAAKAAEAAEALLAPGDAKAFVASLPRPRAILVLVPSGKPLDAVIDTLSLLLEPGDLIADLGNSFYQETEARVTACEARGLVYLGMG